MINEPLLQRSRSFFWHVQFFKSTVLLKFNAAVLLRVRIFSRDLVQFFFIQNGIFSLQNSIPVLAVVKCSFEMHLNLSFHPIHSFEMNFCMQFQSIQMVLFALLLRYSLMRTAESMQFIQSWYEITPFFSTLFMSFAFGVLGLFASEIECFRFSALLMSLFFFAIWVCIFFVYR